MKAIVLAAGVGKRFKEITDQRPKCLIEIQGKTLLERTLSALGAAGVREAVVVIGYRGEMIEQQIGPRCAGVRVRYVFNARYDKGAILSLWTDRAVGFEQVEGLPWTEIDFPADLERAEREVLPRIVALDLAFC